MKAAVSWLNTAQLLREGGRLRILFRINPTSVNYLGENKSCYVCTLAWGGANVVRPQDHLRPLSDSVRLREAELRLLGREHEDHGIEHGQVDLRHWFPRRLQPAQEKRGPLLPQVQSEVGQPGVGAKHSPAVDEAERRVLSFELILDL